MEPHFCGEALYGNDFGLEEIRRWYREEEDAYANIEGSDLAGGHYSYDGVNDWYAWRYIRAQRRKFPHCVALGGARGDDVAPIAPLVNHFTVIEPFRGFWTDEIAGKRARYLAPEISGEIALPTASVDLMTSLGTLHHIANVSFVIREIGRALVPGGLLVLREPIHSMGDWRRPRDGKTRNERGIPVPLMKSWLKAAHLELLRVRYCIFAPLERLRRAPLGRDLWNYRWILPLDELLSSAFSWNDVYLRTNFFQKIAPGAAYMIARRT